MTQTIIEHHRAAKHFLIGHRIISFRLCQQSREIFSIFLALIVQIAEEKEEEKEERRKKKVYHTAEFFVKIQQCGVLSKSREYN